MEQTFENFLNISFPLQGFKYPIISQDVGFS